MNLIKLAVGINNINELRVRQALRYKKYNQNLHITRLFPKKHEIIKTKGSMFWVVNGYISARQKIIDLQRVEHDDGKNYCHIIFDKTIIETQVISHRPFQGWRYLRPEKAPRDLIVNESKNNNGKLYAILEELCII